MVRLLDPPIGRYGISETFSVSFEVGCATRAANFADSKEQQ
jgi:hypothetical protein